MSLYVESPAALSRDDEEKFLMTIAIFADSDQRLFGSQAALRTKRTIFMIFICCPLMSMWIKSKVDSHLEPQNLTSLRVHLLIRQGAQTSGESPVMIPFLLINRRDFWTGWPKRQCLSWQLGRCWNLRSCSCRRMLSSINNIERGPWQHWKWLHLHLGWRTHSPWAPCSINPFFVTWDVETKLRSNWARRGCQWRQKFLTESRRWPHPFLLQRWTTHLQRRLPEELFPRVPSSHPCGFSCDGWLRSR